MSHPAGALSVIESEMVMPGMAVAIPDHSSVVMHPLDVIALRAPSVSDRLAEAMRWILARALAKLDAANPITATPGEN